MTLFVKEKAACQRCRGGLAGEEVLELVNRL